MSGHKNEEKKSGDIKNMNMTTKPDPDSTIKMKDMKEMTMDMKDMPHKPMWQSVLLSALHCGAGCTLADIVGETIGYFWRADTSWWTLPRQWTFDYLLALLFGIIFQYAAITQMSNLPFKKAVFKAIKVDFLSLTSWQIGMYLFMYFLSVPILGHSNIYSNIIHYSFVMQLAMTAGLFIAYPMNWILIKYKIKPGMDM